MEIDMDEFLIEAVRKRPLLYDLKNDDYRCLKKKEAAWKEVAATLNLDENQCKKRWKGLRDSYKRCKKMEKVSKRIGGKTPRRRWRYCKDMSFLDNVKTGRYRDSSFDEYDDGNSTEEHDPIEMESEKSMSSISQAAESNSAEPEEHEESARVTKFDEFLQLAASNISETCSAFVEQRKEQDSTSLLFTSLAAKIKEANLPMRVSNQIEAKVAALVFSEIAQYEDCICEVEDQKR